MRLRLAIALVACLSLGLGCYARYPNRGPYPGPVEPNVHRGHGPPPHAPAHGYRAKQRGHDLRFDSRLGVYLVVGLPGVYWSDGWFYRQVRDRWQRCDDGDGPWNDARWGDVPYRLRGGRDADRGKGKGKDKGWKKDRDWDRH